MCGVYGYIGQQQPLAGVVEGLRKLDYRGYDSWGLAFPVEQKLEYFKSLDSLQTTNAEQFDFQVEFALGHTRWATHGAVNLNNCHPHVSSDGRFALVHNGVVENFQALRNQLLVEGIGFNSETDTEVIVKLVEKQLLDESAESQSEAYQEAVRKVFNRLEGHNTLVLIAVDEQLLIGIRYGSPLVVGKKGEDIFLASDCNAFAHHTQQCLLIDEKQMVICQAGEVKLFDMRVNDFVDCHWQFLETDSNVANKGEYSHFMLKEINEQWQSIPRAVQVDFQMLGELARQIKHQRHLYITGAGAAFFIGEQIAWMLRTDASIKVTCVAAYEGEHFLPEMKTGDVLLAVSQSGETADTLRFVKSAKKQGVSIASVVNMQGAMLSRLSDFDFYSQSGGEVCVLSTKSGTSQLSFGYLLTAALNKTTRTALNDIDLIPAQLSRYFESDSLQDFVDVANTINGEHLYLLGTGAYLTAAKVGALNIKEASYVHAEAFCAGELKHGVIALIEEGTPVICFVDSDNESYMLTVASEVKARGGIIIGVCDKPNPIFDHTLVFPVLDTPVSIITSIVPCQLLAYYLALKKNINPDRPRNLAKSVTVL